MTQNSEMNRNLNIAAYVLAAMLLIFFLSWHLIPALLAGLFIHELVHMSASKVVLYTPIKRNVAKLVVVSIIAILVIAFLVLLVGYLVHFFRYGDENLPALIKKMAEAVDSYKERLPAWLANFLPQDTQNAEDIGKMKTQAVAWLKAHASEITAVTKSSLRVAAHILIGMVIGAMIALYEIGAQFELKPLAKALTRRATNFATSFRMIIFAQFRISAINTLFTALYFLVLVQILGFEIPFVIMMILLTFIFGLLPVIGNIISNVIIVIVSLSVSFEVAIASLIFLMVIHKFEYFLNAKIIGSQTQTKSWEILLAMLIFETLFGLVGVIVAPVYYAYLKLELKQANLV